MSQILPGQRLRDADFEPVEDGLTKFITDLLFEPLARIWREEVGKRLEYQNSEETDRTALLRALRSGRIQYSVGEDGRGAFSGEFSAAIGRALRKMGATFDGRSKVYRLKPVDVPAEVAEAGAAHGLACERAHLRMDQFLQGVYARLDEVVARLDPASISAEEAMDHITVGFQDQVRSVAISFAKPTPIQRRELSAAYTNNAKLWIKKWAADDIARLRLQVEASARTGARASTLVAGISSRYEVSKSKARFLARQETGLFMAQYHKQQFTAAGVPRYVWYTSQDSDVRPAHGAKASDGDHRHLHGRVFTWAEGAPAKYMSSGKNCNPHEDFGCRCVARPLVDTAYNAKFKVGEIYVKEK